MAEKKKQDPGPSVKDPTVGRGHARLRSSAAAALPDR